MKLPRKVVSWLGIGLLCLILVLVLTNFGEAVFERVFPDRLFGRFGESKSEAKEQRRIAPADAVSSATVVSRSMRKPNVALREAFRILNHNPIEFYGQAIDQFGTPVADAEVTGSVLYNTGVSSGIKPLSTSTDAGGHFQLGGVDGQSLGVSLAKEGYQFHARSTLFWYSYFEADHKRHQPEKERPVVFTLWKKQGAEYLIHYSRTWRFPVNLAPIRLDLEKGEMGAPDSDLIVTIVRDPLRMRYGQRGFAWNAVVEVADGGLIRVGSLDYYNLAPESGYQPRFEHVQEAQDLREAQMGRLKWTWGESVADDFFVSSRRGKNFAHVTLRIWPNSDHQEGDNEALVDAEVWLNPNGSRNLEFDPGKVIPLPRK
ncbi:MAG TPA: carboxypeptidase-like regulatory domain-containing protein [Phycisphaerae bacterium]|nr:carboxypeptidase-like regulatory domain-containing protein [Phycisphaerae bacterium]